MPTINDYDDAIRAGRIRFKDPVLKAAKPVMTSRQLKTGTIEEPWRAPGSFAVAYKMEMADGRMRAIRGYFAENAQHSQRYRVLHAELPVKLKDYTVDFRYLDQGIRVDGSPSAPYLPVVDMEWVQGRELRQYVAHIADGADVARLKALAEAWLTMMGRMRAAQIAHGDLSGNNIMVRDNGALVLIDYDGMYTPTLANMPSNEAGAPEYQHPMAQDRRKYGPDMDRFSALLIYVVLRALQERPSLWRQHAEYNGAGVVNLASDRMLFKVEDLKAPATSQLFRELGTLRDPLTLKLVAALKQACVEDINRTPWVGELADPEHAQKIALAALKAAVDADDDRAIAAAETPETRAYAPARVYDARVASAKNNMTTLPTLQQALNRGDDDAQVVALWERMTETATTRPFKPQVEAARKRAALTKQLQQAIRDDDYPGIQWIETQLKGTPTLKPYERAIREVWVRSTRIQVIGRALDKGNDELAVRVWDLAIKEPKLEKRLEPYKTRVDAARARLHPAPAAPAASTPVSSGQDAATQASGKPEDKAESESA